jgi:hypothetical protein
MVMIKSRNTLMAVITGDLVGFSKYSVSGRKRLLSAMKASFSSLRSSLSGKSKAAFEIYRGDSFQGIVVDPASALRVSILLRAELRSRFKAGNRRDTPDMRMAIGIGRVDYLPTNRFWEGDGEAFRLSGPTLDLMKGDQRLLVRTTWPEINAEMDTECALLDSIIFRWSAEQAQAIIGLLKGTGQTESAKAFGISQPAVRHRLRSAGGWAVEAASQRFELLIGDKISPETYKGTK